MELGKNKPATLLLVAVLAVSSLIAVKSLPSLAISKPSVPEILDISFSAHPYDVPPVTSIDPYAGKNITTQAGYRAKNKTIDFTVKNQPYSELEGKLYYQVGYKGHYGDSWSTFFQPLLASSGEYTVLAIPSGILSGPPEGKMDFRVRAGIGYVTSWQYFMDTYVYELHGEKSDWSSTQTIAIGDAAAFYASSSSSASNLSIRIVVVAVMVAAIVGLLVFLKKRKRKGDLIA
jgi:hypothetical protein